MKIITLAATLLVTNAYAADAPSSPVLTRTDLSRSTFKLKQNLAIEPGDYRFAFDSTADCKCEGYLNNSTDSASQAVFSAGRTFEVSSAADTNIYLNSSEWRAFKVTLIENNRPANSSGLMLNQIYCRRVHDIKLACTDAQAKAVLSRYFEITHFTYPNVEAGVLDESESQGLVHEGDLPQAATHGI